MTIKKKSSWYEHTPPAKPTMPVKPVEHWSTEVLDEVWSGERCRLADSKLPESIKLEDLVVESRGDSGSYASVCIPREIQTANQSYENEMKRYKKVLFKHEIAVKAWEDDVKQWRQWKDEKDKLRLEARLKAAEKLLKKHGKL